METDAAFLLRILADGKPHTLEEILQASFAERGCGLTVHSRAAELRKQGHDVVNRVSGGARGRRVSVYRLVKPEPVYQCSAAESASQDVDFAHDPNRRVEATTTPEGGEGWDAGQARHVDPARGHGVDVAPDPQPEGVRAETRRWNDGAGGEPSNAPVAEQLALTDSAAAHIFRDMHGTPYA